MTTYASARGGGWIDVRCDDCGTRYSCLVQGLGTASNQFLPLSEETLKEVARADLSAELAEKAARIPCPQCGAIGEAMVEEIQDKARRRTFWAILVGGGPILLILVTTLLNTLFPRHDPKGPPPWFIWILVGSVVTAWIAARKGAQYAYEKADLNRDLAANKRSTQRRVAAGQVKVISEPGKG